MLLSGPYWFGSALLCAAVALAIVPISAPRPNVIAASKSASPPIAPIQRLPPVEAGEGTPKISALGAGFELYRQGLIQLARTNGISELTIQRHLGSLTLSERAIQLDRAQRPVSASPSSISPPLSPYLKIHVTPALISRGQARYYNRWPDLVRIHSRYGVDPAVLMSIYGKETGYGSITGNFDLLNVLASLAYEGRRRAMFEGEFIAALKLIDAGTSRERLKGSYAGATGYPQFMPSVVLRLRADGDGDGMADIWTSEVDALASIANYLKDAGWKPGVPWGAAVTVPATLNRAALRRLEESPRCPAVFRRHSRMLPVSQWRSMGVVPSRGSLPDTEPAALMEPGGGEAAYLLTSNYNAILGYNCSNFYAMSVALLADRIARR